MRHAIAGNKLGRNQTLRKATVRDIAKATLIQQRICTTKAKAKESRKMVDQLITLGKKGSLANKRKAFAILCDHKLVSRLFTTIAPKFAERPGGYTRIISLGNRRGDNAEMAFLELTEKSEVLVSKSKAKSAVKTSDSDATETKANENKPKTAKPAKDISPRKGKMGGLGKIFNRKTPDSSK
jgi:large subunit ribosomal protein L17